MDNLELSSVQDDDTTGGTANPDLSANDPAANSEPVANANPIEAQATAQPINEPGGKQPTGTEPDPIALLNAKLGEMKVNGATFEGLKSIEHLQRLIQQANGSQKEISTLKEKAGLADQYNELRKPYEWLNEKSQDPKVQRVFQHMRFTPGFLEKIAGWIPEWEQRGELDPNVLKLGQTQMELEQHKAQIGKYTEAEQKQQQAQAEQAEITGLNEMVNDANNGIPFTQQQTSMLVVFRDGARARLGNPNYSVKDALNELKGAGLWKPAGNPQQAQTARTNAARLQGNPPAQRPPNNPPSDDTEFLNRFKKVAGWS